MSSSFVRRAGLACIGVAAVSFSTAATAMGAPPPRPLKAQTFKLSSPTTTERNCATRSVTGKGVVRHRYRAASQGVLTARLAGPERSDWDLAIVDARTNKALTGSASNDSQEIAYWAVAKGRRLAVQACRHSGGSSVKLSLQFTKVDFAALARENKGEKAILARVKLKGGADAAKLQSLGLDLSDHGTSRYRDVLLYSGEEQSKLRSAGLTFKVREADVLAKRRRDIRSERRAAKRGKARAAQGAPRPPRGNRTSYRRLEDFQLELRELADDNPDVVRVFELPRRSIEGRRILGVEVAEGVGKPDDGRPSFVNLGAHHAREWPSGEATMEWLLDLVAGYRAGDPRMVNVVRNSRTFHIPVVNVDGYYATINSERNSLEDPDAGDAIGYEQAFAIGAYKRKNCSTGDPVTEAQPCLLRTRPPSWPGAFERRVTDLPFRGPRHRPQPQLRLLVGWPGHGAHTTGTSGFGTTYHGPGPFSEPETEALREWSRDLNLSVLIGNHTYTGLILRPPGTSTDGPAEDELNMRELGDAMALETTTCRSSGISSTTRPARSTTTSTAAWARTPTRRRSGRRTSTRTTSSRSSRIRRPAAGELRHRSDGGLSRRSARGLYRRR